MARSMLICWRYRLAIVCGLLLFRCEQLQAYANQHPPLSSPATQQGEAGGSSIGAAGNGADTSGFEASGKDYFLFYFILLYAFDAVFCF